jgi:hypothetical protein
MESTSPHWEPSPAPAHRWRVNLLLLIPAVLAGLLWGFYAEENWRGERAWQACQADLAAQNLSLDWQPPKPLTMPHEENFTATPFLKKYGLKGWATPFAESPLRAATQGKLVEYLGQAGELARLAEFQAELRAHPGVALPPLPREPALDVLDSFNPIRPLMDELRRASPRRYSVFPIQGASPIMMDTPNFVTARDIVHLFAMDASAQLALRNPGGAFEDLRVIARVAEAMKSGQTLASAMIETALLCPHLQAFWEGWALGQWTETEWLAFQSQFQQLDFLSDIDQALRHSQISGLNHWLNTCSRSELTQVLRVTPPKDNFDPFAMLAKITPKLGFSQNQATYNPFLGFPRGWIRQNQVVYNRLLAALMVGPYDAARQRVYPRRVDEGERAMNAIVKQPSPFNILGSLLTPNLARLIPIVTQRQTLAQQAEVVCALERYRLKTGRYPETLPTLVPGFMEKLPLDLITGEPFHYRASDGAHFLLYSVGWDEKDDGGQAVNRQKWGAASGPGDWTWPSKPR